MCDFCVSVCLSVCLCVRAFTVAILNRLRRNLAQTSGTWTERTLSLGVKIQQGYPLFLPNFTPNWHPRNAFSMGDLKCFSDIINGPIIAVHSSNNVPWRLPTPECENRVKEGVARVTWPAHFWALNANSSKMAKDTKFKFGRRVSRDSPDMTHAVL